MGRRRKPIKKLKAGCVYFLDRRFGDFLIYRQIVSRQHSRNYTKGNVKCFPIHPAPVNTTAMVSEHTSFFGREYAKVLIANSEQDVTMGYIELQEFLKIIRGTPRWVTLFP